MLARPIEPEDLYRRVGRLIESAPSFEGIGPLAAEQMTWLGRAEALIDVSDDISARAEFALGKSKLTFPSQRPIGFQGLMLALYKVLANAELKAPPGSQGAFIPVGSSFDAYAAVSKILSSGKTDILIVDPYMDDSVLLEFGGTLIEGVTLRLLTDTATVRPNLAPAALRWKSQYPSRPLDVRMAAPKALHDRAIFVDRKDAWAVTQSLKDLAKRSPAEIVRADDTAPLKIAAYEDIWSKATIIV